MSMSEREFGVLLPGAHTNRKSATAVGRKHRFRAPLPYVMHSAFDYHLSTIIHALKKVEAKARAAQSTTAMEERFAQFLEELGFQPPPDKVKNAVYRIVQGNNKKLWAWVLENVRSPAATQQVRRRIARAKETKAHEDRRKALVALVAETKLKVQAAQNAWLEAKVGAAHCFARAVFHSVIAT